MSSGVYTSHTDPFLAMIAVVQKYLGDSVISGEERVILENLQKFLYTLYVEDDYMWDEPVEIGLRNLRFSGLNHLQFKVQILLNDLHVADFYVKAMIEIFQGKFPEQKEYNGMHQAIDLAMMYLPSDLKVGCESSLDIEVIIVCTPPNYAETIAEDKALKEAKAAAEAKATAAEDKLTQAKRSRQKRRRNKTVSVAHAKALFLRIGAKQAPMNFTYHRYLKRVRDIHFEDDLVVSRKDERMIIIRKCIAEIQQQASDNKKIDIVEIAELTFKEFLK